MLIKNLSQTIFFLFLLVSCVGKPTPQSQVVNQTEDDPVVREDGKLIIFPDNSLKTKIFLSCKAENKNLTIRFSAPANVIGRVNYSSGSPDHKIILFDSPDLTTVYSGFLQNRTLLKTARINLSRVTDLFKNGAATGKELNDASSEMLNLETSLSSSEALLRESGLNPENLNNAALGTVWLICDLPESELNSIKKGQKYQLQFPSFPSESFSANIDVIADVMNSQTRKIRVRLSLSDRQERIRPGMYAQVNFEIPHNGLMVPKKSVLSTNARYYVFIRKSISSFERREVVISSEAGDYIEISNGVDPGEEIVYENVYLLKGIVMGI